MRPKFMLASWPSHLKWQNGRDPMSESKSSQTYLVVSQEEARHKIQVQVEKAQLIRMALASAQKPPAFGLTEAFAIAKEDQERWAKYTIELLNVLFSNDSISAEFGGHWINYSIETTQKQHVDQLAKWLDQRIVRLKSCLDRLPLFRIKTDESTQVPRFSAQPAPSNEVFIVHGHDSGVKDSVARFLEKLGLTPIILHEQPDKGRTIIEKFEAHSNVGFAVVILTPDDVGYPQADSSKLKLRARQNVILELGFFLGKLGRNRVCALKKDNIELPSDYDGVLYKCMDERDAWKIELAKEIREAGIAVDLRQAF